MKIFAQNKQYAGISAGVGFTSGVGECTDPHVLDWFKSKGYTIEEPEAEVEKMTVDELTAYAEENNIDIAQSTSRKGNLKKILEAGNKTE